MTILGQGGFSGDIYSNVLANPVSAADASFVDNVHGPLKVTVSFVDPTGLPGEEEPALSSHMFIPLVKR